MHRGDPAVHRKRRTVRPRALERRLLLPPPEPGTPRNRGEGKVGRTMGGDGVGEGGLRGGLRTELNRVWQATRARSELL